MFTRFARICPDKIMRCIKRPIFWIVLLGFVLRLGSMSVNYPMMRWQNDQRMAIPAARLLEGKGFTLADGAGPSAYRPPLYVLWLAGAYAIFGKFATLGPSFLQVLVSAGNILLLFLLTKQIWKREDVANAAALLLAVHPYSVYHDPALYHTFLSTALLLGGFLFLFKGLDHARGGQARLPDGQAHRPALTQFLFSGLLFGSCVLIMSVIVPFLALLVAIGLIVWRIPFVRRLTFVGYFVAGFAIAWGPWIVRNAVAFHHFIPLTMESGVTLWMGNNPNARELLKARGHEASPVPKGTAFNLPQFYEGCATPDWCRGGISEYEESRELTGMATQWIKTHLIDFVSLTTWRFKGIWSPFLTPEKSFSSHFVLNVIVKYGYFVWNLVLFVLFLIGARLAWKEKRRAELVLPVLLALSATGAYSLFLYYTKYRIPFEATLLPFAGAGLASVWKKFTSHFFPVT